MLIRDYITIDNVLSNPQRLVELTKKIPFIRRSCDDVDGIKSQLISGDLGWKGLRSDLLSRVDENIHQDILNEVFQKVLGFECNWGTHTETYLHFAPESIKKDETWWHTDPHCLFAGVIYLNPEPLSNSGTILKIEDREVVLENKFNRLSFYKSNILHRPENVFGNTGESSRLTLTLFVRKICLDAIPFMRS